MHLRGSQFNKITKSLCGTNLGTLPGRLVPRVGCTMNRRSPFRFVVHFLDSIFELQSRP